MKFKITLKDPDGFSNGILEAARSSLVDIHGLSEKERELLLDDRLELVKEELNTWIEYGEYVTLEFDTERGTAIVLEQ